MNNKKNYAKINFTGIDKKEKWGDYVLAAFILIAGIILFDQITKIMVENHFIELESIGVIDNIFYLTYVPNYGAAFGILKNKTIFFIIIGIIIITGLLIYLQYIPKQRKTLKLALILQIAGALGNMIDRIRLGYVIDFLDFRIWPVFNIADMAIVIGAIFLIYDVFFLTPKKVLGD